MFLYAFRPICSSLRGVICRFGSAVYAKKYSGLTTAHTDSLFPKSRWPKLDPKRAKKNHNIAFSYRGRAFQTPLFRQSLSLRVRLKATHTHSLFPNSGDEIQRSIICCTYVRDCGVTLRKDAHMVRLLNIGSHQSSNRAKTNQKPIRMN